MIYRDEECSAQPSAIVAHELLSRRTVRKWTTGPAWPGGGSPRYASVLVKGFALTALSVSGQPAASFDSRTQWSCPARASGTVSGNPQMPSGGRAPTIVSPPPTVGQKTAKTAST